MRREKKRRRVYTYCRRGSKEKVLNEKRVECKEKRERQREMKNDKMYWNGME